MPLLCRVCVAQQAQGFWLTAPGVGRAGRKRKKATRPSILHTLSRRNKGAG